MSPTKPAVPAAEVERLIRAALGPSAAVRAVAEFTGGGFATVLRVEVAGGAVPGAPAAVVVKVGPARDVPLLGYEAGVVAAEARYLRLAAAELPGICFPRVLGSGAGEHDWLVTTLLPGVPLTEVSDSDSDSGSDRVRSDAGAAMARLHTVTGAHFGYDDDRPHADTWRGAFVAMVDALLEDARRWNVDLGLPLSEISELVRRRSVVLDVVDKPALLHFDLWDGNLLCAPDAAGDLRLTGIVDGERFLFGDPLFDFVSPALYRRIEDQPDHPFLRGYAEASGQPVVFDDSATRRLALYRLHLALLMAIEVPSRGMTDQHGSPRRRVLQAALAEAARAGR